MKIVITGGLGFIGTHLAKTLIAAGHDVLLLDSLSAQIHGEVPSTPVPEGAQVMRLDVRELVDRSDLFEGCDVVYHLASETGTAQSMYNIVNYVDVNETGTAALMEAIGRCTNKPGKVVLTSSRSVYGEGGYVSPDRPDVLVTPNPRTAEQLARGEWEPVVDGKDMVATATREDCAIVPSSIYAATKASQEHLVRVAAESVGIKSVIFRLQNVYGEGQSLRNPYTGIISIFFNRARQGLGISIYEDGLESRDFVHVQDVVSALVTASEADMPSGLVMNIGYGQPTQVHDLAKKLLSAANLDVPLTVTGQYRVGDIRHGWADISRARSVIGFEPQVDLDQGLKRFTDWASAEPAHKDLLDKATAELRKHGLTN